MLHVSVVDHARVDDLLACLRTLPAACEGLDWRLTVVENVAGTDIEAVRGLVPGAEIVVSPRPRGFGANHNAVLRTALASPDTVYSLVLNDDTELPPGSITALVRFAEVRPHCAAVAPRIVDRAGAEQAVMLPFPTVRSEFMSALARSGDDTAMLATRGGWLNGACLLLRAEALRRVGLFDERFFLFYEDTDLCRRLRDAGWQVEVCADSQIVHAGHGTVGDPRLGSLMERQRARSAYLYLRKHRGALPAEVLRHTGHVARRLRAAKAGLEARMHPGATAAAQALLLRELADYDLRTALPHEA